MYMHFMEERGSHGTFPVISILYYIFPVPDNSNCFLREYTQCTCLLGKGGVLGHPSCINTCYRMMYMYISCTSMITILNAI